MTRKRITAIIITLAAIATAGGLLTGCAKFTEPFRDAPVSTHNSTPMEVIEMGDGFSNIGDKCDGHGHRVYVVFHGDHAYGAITAVTDPRCPG